MSDPICVGMLDIKGKEQIRRVYDAEGIAPTLTAKGGGNHEVKVLIEETPEDYKIIDPQGRKGKRCKPSRLAPTLRAEAHGNHPMVVESKARVRKLTPREYYRLMSFTDEQFNRAQKVVSNTQLYKTAGNSINVDVLAAIFKEMIS